MYRVRVTGRVDVLAQGSHLVVAHCGSALDGVLLGLFLPRQPLVATTMQMQTRRLPRWLSRWLHRCQTADDAVLRAKAVVHHVSAGGIAVMFPQGGVSDSRSQISADEAVGMVARHCGDEIVPVSIRGAQHSRYATASQAWPRRLMPRITIEVHPPVRIAHDAGLPARERRRDSAVAVQATLQNVQSNSVSQRGLFDAFVDAVELHGRSTRIVEDARRRPESYAQLLRTSLALGRVLSRETAPGETVGILLPSVSTTLGLLLGLVAHGRVAAMLNYSAGVGLIRDACLAAGVRTVITSREFLAGLGIPDAADHLTAVRMIYAEDLRSALTLRDRLWLIGYAQWCPRAVVPAVDPKQAAVVLFTSGSEGASKGVVLSHAAMLANMAQLQSVIDFGPADKFFSALPLYHIFGLVACSLMPLMTGTRLFVYVSPLRYRAIPSLVRACRATYLFGTSTFLSHYARQAQAGDFQSLRRVICGGEKLDAEVARLWQDKFGLNILEGYGATECGPAMALNTPLASKRNTVGRFLPGIEYRLVPVPGIATGGALHVRGPNLMSGYLCVERPGTLIPPRSAAGEGWHDTGDVVEIDAQGYVTVVGRTRRFAKIAGEMISLDAVERVALHASPEHRHAAILAPVVEKGEGIWLFTTDPRLERSALLRAARSCGVSHLAAPRRIQYVAELPQLGNGKTDYVALNTTFTEIAAPAIP